MTPWGYVEFYGQCLSPRLIGWGTLDRKSICHTTGKLCVIFVKLALLLPPSPLYPRAIAGSFLDWQRPVKKAATPLSS